MLLPLTLPIRVVDITGVATVTVAVAAAAFARTIAKATRSSGNGAAVRETVNAAVSAAERTRERREGGSSAATALPVVVATGR